MDKCCNVERNGREIPISLPYEKKSGGEGFPGGASGKEPACQCRRLRDEGLTLGQEDLLEEGMATHSSILAWEIPRTEEPGGLQSIRSQRAPLLLLLG